MTQRQISHPEGLQSCKAGHSARHMHYRRALAAGGGHFIECRCGQTHKHAEPSTALAEWQRMNRPARKARPAAPITTDNVVQLQLHMANTAAPARRQAGDRHGSR